MADLYPGSQTIIYTQIEDTYGTPRHPSGGRTMYTISENLEGAEERELRPDRSGNADHQERYIGRKSASWEITKLVLPNGTAGTQPDDAHLWQVGCGAASVGGTAVEYQLATLHNTSLTIRRGIRSGVGASGQADFQDHVIGAICNRVEVTWGQQGNNGLAQVVFAGESKEYGHTGNTSIKVTGAGETIGAGTTGVSLDQVLAVSPHSAILIGGDTGGGSGILVDTANYTSGRISWSETLDSTHSHGDVVKPYNPTASTSGSPIHARLGQLSIDGGSTTIKHMGGRVTMEDNRSLLNEEVGSDSATQVIRTDRRNTTFALDFIMKADETWMLGDVRRNQQKDIEITIGDVSGERLMMILPVAEFDFTPADIPEQEVARISLEGLGLQSNGNDSVKYKFF